MLDCMVARQSVEPDDWVGFSVIAGPSSETSHDPSGEGEGSVGVWIFLANGLAFEAGGDRFENGLFVGIERIGERALSHAIALVDQLQHADSGNECGGNELLEWSLSSQAQRFNLKALALEGAEQLLDCPTRPVEADDPAGIADSGHAVGREQAPMGRFDARRRIDSQASIMVSTKLAGKVAAVAARGRPLGRAISTVPVRKASTAVRAVRPGAAGSSIVMRPASGSASALANRRDPSAQIRSWLARTSSSTACGFSAKSS